MDAPAERLTRVVFRRATNWRSEVAGASETVTIHGARVAVGAIYDE